MKSPIGAAAGLGFAALVLLAGKREPARCRLLFAFLPLAGGDGG